MGKDITPYVKSKIPMRALMFLNKNIKIVTIVLLAMTIAVLVFGWFILSDELRTFYAWIIESIVAALAVSAFDFIMIRGEFNAYKLSWIQFVGLVSFMIGAIYSVVSMIINDDVGFELILLISIWSIIALQRFAKYDVDEDDT